MAALAVALAVAFSAPNHAPKVNVNWYYAVRVSEHGKPVRARLTLQIVDPLGSVHAVYVGSTTRPITNYPIKGVYRDYLTFPPESRGVPLKIRAIVVAGHARRVLIYLVTPRR